jgi:thioredoxin 1
MATEITVENFEQLTNEGVCLVDFWAPWCGPCRMLSPTIDTLAEEFEGKVLVGKVNVDENQDLSMKFGVRSIPTIVIMKDGEVVETMIGAQSQSDLAEKINSHI